MARGRTLLRACLPTHVRRSSGSAMTYSAGPQSGPPAIEPVAIRPAPQPLVTTPAGKRYPQRLRRAGACLLLFAPCLWFALAPAAAQQPAGPKTLRVAVKPIAPFVLKQGPEW